ncbi:hypothetical protein T484DRAFT_1916953, partial [Baffinella frigidus]
MAGGEPRPARGDSNERAIPERAIGRGDDAPKKLSDGREGYPGRGWGAVTKRGGGQLNARQLTGVIKDCREAGELARILQEQSGALDQIHVSAAWVCLARIGRGRGGGEVGDVVGPLQEKTRGVLDQAGGRQIANVMHSMAKLHKWRRWLDATDRGLLEAMQRRATATVGEFKPQNVANMLWALATMGERADRGLLEAMQRRATATAGDFKPQGVGNVLWALATMGEKVDPGLLKAMQGRATETAGDFKPQEVANVLWALATMGEKADPGLLEAMQRRAMATAGEFNSQDVGNVLWALATIGEGADRELLKAMQRRATATAGEYKPQGVGNVLWALATMGESANRELLDAMGGRATETAGEFKPQDVGNVLWALATMGGAADPGLLEAMQRRATAAAAEFNPQDVANVLWALTVLGGGAGGILQEGIGMDRLAARVLELRHQFTDGAKSQLHHWLLACDLSSLERLPGASGAALPSDVARVKHEMGGECLAAFSALEVLGGRASLLQLQKDPLQEEVCAEVSAALRSAGLEVEVEEGYRDARSGYTIHVLVRPRAAETAQASASAGTTAGGVSLEG